MGKGRRAHLGAFALGDVVDNIDDPDDLPCGVPQRSIGLEHPTRFSSLGNVEVEVYATTRFSGQGLLYGCQDAGFLQEREDFGGVLPQHLAGGQARQLFHKRIPDLAFQVPVVNDDALLRTGHDLLVELA
jgi:hypothetical protein